MSFTVSVALKHYKQDSAKPVPGTVASPGRWPKIANRQSTRVSPVYRAIFLSVVSALALAGCDIETTSVSQPSSEPLPQVTRSGRPQSINDFRAVVAQVEPVAERACRDMKPRSNCDFAIVVESDPRLPPNAYQTLDRSGRPVIGFTQALFKEMMNRDELAFALSHEAAHHIEGHIAQTQASAQTGAILGAVLGSVVGLDQSGVEVAQNIGGTVGARRFSKGFELEADALGARIARRAGYDPVRGVLYFQDASDPGDRFLGTHPPNADRIRVVRQAVGG
ncbi:MAG: M48 family metallopeptidase [Silicimonas sp.]|nr:M48 family metallopeptidase [Silicimonas sp.]NND42995.1 M48 family metalloprotease [Silicimonas sp.]RZW12387.1 MAG: peptidase M48 [Paracoccaceae bacterium]